MFCEKPDHRSSDCKTAKTVTNRNKKLCFNCTGVKHGAVECRSNKTGLKCKNKHHTSIRDKPADRCDKLADSKSEPMLVTPKTNVTYPVAIIKANGVKCRVLLDTDSGSSCISESCIDLPKINPVRYMLS